MRKLPLFVPGVAVLVGALCLTCCAVLSAQDKPSSVPAAARTLPVYADNSDGLEKFVKDILRAEKEGKAESYNALVSSLAQPVPEAWYDDTFGQHADAMFHEYQLGRPRIEAELHAFFLKMVQEKATYVTASKHQATCDDNAGELIYPVLALRQEQVPLYELRFHKGKEFYRLWALAYVDGAFRFAGNLNPPESFPPTPAKRPNVDKNAPNAPEETEKRIPMGGNVVAAQILYRVQPEYPEIARLEHLQGTVKLHALIARDGSIQNLRVITGYCSLAEAAMRAVRQWRYRPTLLGGQPVEVDTTIDVIYTLKR